VNNARLTNVKQRILRSSLFQLILIEFFSYESITLIKPKNSFENVKRVLQFKNDPTTKSVQSVKLNPLFIQL
jgi:hypothetical protein